MVPNWTGVTALESSDRRNTPLPTSVTVALTLRERGQCGSYGVPVEREGRLAAASGEGGQVRRCNMRESPSNSSLSVTGRRRRIVDMGLRLSMSVSSSHHRFDKLRTTGTVSRDVSPMDGMPLPLMATIAWICRDLGH